MSYKSTRLLVEAIYSGMEMLRKQLMSMPPDPDARDAKCGESIETLNELRGLIDELQVMADKPTIDGVTKLSPGEYVATMKPLVANYHRQLMSIDKLAPCLCEDLQASGVILMLIGDGKTVVRTSYDPAREEVQLAVEAILATLDGGIKTVMTEGVEQVEQQLGIEARPHWSDCATNQGGECDMGPECGSEDPGVRMGGSPDAGEQGE